MFLCTLKLLLLLPFLHLKKKSAEYGISVLIATFTFKSLKPSSVWWENSNWKHYISVQRQIFSKCGRTFDMLMARTELTYWCANHNKLYSVHCKQPTIVTKHYKVVYFYTFSKHRKAVNCVKVCKLCYWFTLGGWLRLSESSHNDIL